MKNPFGWLLGLLKKVFQAAKDNGLTDEIVQLALGYVKRAATDFTDNTQRREWVVGLLMAKGVPESLARFAVEAAVQLIKREEK